MRGAGEVLLVSCYELGRQPLGVALPKAFLERAGFQPDSIDLAVEKLDEAKAKRAKLVVVSVPMHTALRIGARAASRIKVLNPSAEIAFVGLYAALNAAHLLAHHGDYVLAGEAEGELVRLAESREKGLEYSGSESGTKERLQFPTPSRRSLPTLSTYARLDVGGVEKLAGAIEATRGCLHTCRHCPITPVYEGRFFAVPRDVVLADAEQQIAAGAQHLTFGDPDFLNGPRHALELARALHARHPAITFDATIKVEHVLKHRDLFPELAKLGLLFVVSAFESLNDVVLDELDKGHTAADLSEAVQVVRGAGIAIRPTFVAFSPWETLASRLALFDFLEREALLDEIDPIQLTLRLLIPPKSPLVERERMKPHLGPLEPAAFAYTWTHPDARMDALQRESAAYVEAGEKQALPRDELFDTLRRMTSDAAGAPTRVLPRADRIGRPRAPRLTETWFC